MGLLPWCRRCRCKQLHRVGIVVRVACEADAVDESLKLLVNRRLYNCSLTDTARGSLVCKYFKVA